MILQKNIYKKSLLENVTCYIKLNSWHFYSKKYNCEVYVLSPLLKFRISRITQFDTTQLPRRPKNYPQIMRLNANNELS